MKVLRRFCTQPVRRYPAAHRTDRIVVLLVVLKQLFAFYGRVDRGVLAGLVAIFVFGIFYETTMLSYGALIFCVLLK